MTKTQLFNRFRDIVGFDNDDKLWKIVESIHKIRCQKNS
jgi:hypothetical protein